MWYIKWNVFPKFENSDHNFRIWWLISIGQIHLVHWRRLSFPGICFGVRTLLFRSHFQTFLDRHWNRIWNIINKYVVLIFWKHKSILGMGHLLGHDRVDTFYNWILFTHFKPHEHFIWPFSWVKAPIRQVGQAMLDPGSSSHE